MALAILLSTVPVYLLNLTKGDGTTDSVNIELNCADFNSDSTLYPGKKYGLVKLSGDNTRETNVSNFHSTDLIAVDDNVETEIIFSTKRNGDGSLIVTIPSEYLSHDENYRPKSITVTPASIDNKGSVKIGTEVDDTTRSSMFAKSVPYSQLTLLEDNLDFDVPHALDSALLLPLVLDSDDHAYTLLNKSHFQKNVIEGVCNALYEDKEEDNNYYDNYTSDFTPTEDCIFTINFIGIHSLNKNIYFNGNPINYSTGINLTGQSIGAIIDFDILVTVKYDKANNLYQFLNCHRVNNPIVETYEVGYPYSPSFSNLFNVTLNKDTLPSYTKIGYVSSNPITINLHAKAPNVTHTFLVVCEDDGYSDRIVPVYFNVTYQDIDGQEVTAQVKYPYGLEYAIVRGVNKIDVLLYPRVYDSDLTCLACVTFGYVDLTEK